MKRYTELHVKSMEAVKKIIANNYPDYTISSTSKQRFSFWKKRVVYIHLKYRDDYRSSVMVVFNPNKNVMEVKKDNGNKTRKSREFYQYIFS
ncbi:hypothetical protein [Peribacillus asahii]|uniref:hypothetical protein n=1 Tax=Peribacillus asahii TaxID=228899 RepID=UPI003802216E